MKGLSENSTIGLKQKWETKPLLDTINIGDQFTIQYILNTVLMMNTVNTQAH